MGFGGRRTGGHFDSLIEEEEKKERPKIASDWTLAKWILGFMFREYKGQVIIALILVGLSSVISLVSPQIMRYLIDEVFDLANAFTTEKRLLYLLLFTLSLLGVAIVTAILSIFRTILLNKIGYSVVKKIRTDTFNHLQKMSIKYFDTQEAGRLISKVTNDCDKINEMVSGEIITSIIDFITLIGIIGILLWMDWILALWVFVLSIPITVFISWTFRIRARKAYRKTRKTIATVTANLSESISGVRVSKSFTRESKNIQEFRTVNEENKQANMKAIAVFATTFPLFNFLASAVIGFVYFYGGYTQLFPETMFIHSVSIGSAIAFTQYVGTFFEPILNLTMFYNTFQSTMAATERVYEMNHTSSDVIEHEDAYELPEIQGHIKFDNVVFGYKENELVLNQFNLEVQPGESIAIVGPTGSGKTTIINLLARFYEIQDGAIFIDGHNIQDVTLNSLHRQMGIVLQDPYLFTGSIAENIVYNQIEAPFEDIQNAANAVNAAEFIENLHKGYETQVGERGSKLSLGQRQLISFARALLPNPKILILDEATSSVDPYTELLIKKALTKLLSGRTSFIIAHRLSTVRNADRIVVIKNGKIIEEGTNEDLLARKGEYYRLYQLQFKDQESDEEEL
ncbi:MAG: ABC transporter ATP-binding protein [Candidatus Heimdallarchaeota archaeon]|nr:ABC transporter ATP-binding protein [Candidatus Heimdallarchaeota archaeon]